MVNTTAKGNAFEKRSYEIITAAINGGEFGIIPANCKVFQKKGYYSDKRRSEIIFDLTIEVWPEGASNFSLLYIVECKDYRHKVPVDDLEEFESKFNQVTGSKGIYIARNGFQQGAFTLAKSNRVMLIEVDENNKPKVILHNSKKKRDVLQDYPVSIIAGEIDQLAKIGKLLQQDTTFDPDKFDSELYDFLNNALNSGVTRNDDSNACELFEVGYLSKKLLEDMGNKIIRDFEPTLLNHPRPFPLEYFVAYLNEKFDVEVINNNSIPHKNGKEIFGYYDRAKKQIHIDVSLVGTERYAFILAHEIAHFFLHTDLEVDQSVYENLEDSSYDSSIGKHRLINDRQWIEWQASQLAACILLPKYSVMYKLVEYQTRVGIRNRGTIYVDNYPQNVSDFKNILCILSDYFGVSSTNFKYRLSDLGILTYGKGGKSPASQLGSNYRRPKTIGEILGSAWFWSGGNWNNFS